MTTVTSAAALLGEAIVAGGISQLALRFMSFVTIMQDGCWHFTGAQDGLGYGSVGKTLHGTSRAHRAAYQLFKGEIPAAMHVLHSCDVRHCVNPDHLSIGTHTDNMRDMVRKGRIRITRHFGETNPQSKLTADDVCDIRARVAAGEKQNTVVKDYPVGHMAISRIIRRETWSHVS